MAFFCFSDTLQFHVTPAILHRMLQKAPQIRCGFKYVSVLNSWVIDYQLKLATNSKMKNIMLTNLICLTETSWVFTHLFCMSPVHFWFSDEFLEGKGTSQTRNYLIVQGIPNFQLQRQEIWPLQGPQDSKPCYMRKALLPLWFLWLSQVGVPRQGIWQPREAGRKSHKEMLC